MKKTLMLICAAFAITSCIDTNYDLADLNTDNTTLGGDQSEFKMPLASIEISLDQVSQDDLDLESVFEQADVWLPSPLPAGAKSVDLVALKENPAYLETLINALVRQMETQTAKLDLVTDFIWDNYRQNFEHLLGQIPGIDLTNPVHFKSAFKLAFKDPNSDIVKQEAITLARKDLLNMDIDPISYSISPIDISDDLIDMLAQNIDPADVMNPKNTLHMYGHIVSELPVGLRLAPAFIGTSAGFSVDLKPGVEATIPQIRLFESDIRTIVSGVMIVVPITLLEYFPGRRFDSTQQITLTLSLLKRGGLTINL